jgi:hypothetical protein
MNGLARSKKGEHHHGRSRRRQSDERSLFSYLHSASLSVERFGQHDKAATFSLNLGERIKTMR